jgi:hypothetical protein
MSEPVTEEKVVPVAGEAAPKDEVAVPFIGGEVHIIADAKTGGIQVSAPPNLIIALGLLESAKEILLANMRAQNAAAMRAQRPAIVPAGAGSLRALDEQLKRKPS